MDNEQNPFPLDDRQAESLARYFESLSNPDELCFSFGLDNFSPNDMAQNIRARTDLAREFAVLFIQDFKKDGMTINDGLCELLSHLSLEDASGHEQILSL